jgi:hypothetical protein
LDSARAAWLRALVEASGPGRTWVNAREIAAVLSDRRGMRQRATSHAAGANLRWLRSDGYAEAEMADGWSWWRPTDAGVAEAAD